jgi:hypothetical protein
LDEAGGTAELTRPALPMTTRLRRLPVALRLAVLLLLGSAGFGAWHVAVGGLVQGNEAAARFGALLAIASVVLLGVVAAAAGRVRRA